MSRLRRTVNYTTGYIKILWRLCKEKASVVQGWVQVFGFGATANKDDWQGLLRELSGPSKIP